MSKMKKKQKTQAQICYFHLILGIFRKSRNDDSYITQFYFVIIHREYHKTDLHAITSRLRGHLPILSTKNPNVNIGGKGVKMG